MESTPAGLNWQPGASIESERASNNVQRPTSFAHFTLACINGHQVTRLQRFPFPHQGP